ncbi:MAG: flagellar basal body-associated FliL family protein [Sulfuricellaceae bacterium]|nr:flagellar basal body-associated FliL family protein [Sulfuricellaceae bacterium]
MRKFLVTLATLILLSSAVAHGQSKESGGGASPYAKMEPLIVNLSGLTNYLQVEISFKVADPKVADEIKLWKPAIRHELLLLLGSYKPDEIATLAGKQKVMKSIRTAVNKILKKDEKTGVTDVLFESFVIQ